MGYDNVSIINEDILKLDLNEIIMKDNNGKPAKVVANLPYYITTPIIMGLLEGHVPVSSITVMVQKEVADRMQANTINIFFFIAFNVQSSTFIQHFHLVYIQRAADGTFELRTILA